MVLKRRLTYYTDLQESVGIAAELAELALVNQVDDVTTNQLMIAPYSKVKLGPSVSLRFSFTAFFSSSHVIFFSQPFDTILPK